MELIYLLQLTRTLSVKQFQSQRSRRFVSTLEFEFEITHTLIYLKNKFYVQETQVRVFKSKPSWSTISR